MTERPDDLISATELAAGLAAPPPGGGRVVLLDVRWKLGDPHGADHYRDGHLPGAVYVDLDRELSGEPTATSGRHPLPDPERFEAAVRGWGVNDGDTVVAYDDAGGFGSARAWWLLRHAGHDDVRVLDGGLGAWIAAGHPIEQGTVTPEPGTVGLSWGRMPVVELPDVDAAARDGVLLDARAGERYRGETEPVDPKAGHIPGALSAPTADNVTAEGTMLPADALRSRFDALGVTGAVPVTAYCGSGVSAAQEVLALRRAGIDAALFPGSWSQYAATDRPVATGVEPG
ncbi:sulfurtransferase [Tersicoccus sp. Bi-70]|uniref:sulfurtransferase n=1 Tax=Tersicoccus sp. Bi-70 TaxID=1897634 RepID=UPI000977390F|nr:sulfurtransferase [Tersicoccus sp. Bi-70]OMH36620.1 thiosulfate sulfurtransferase [Tersicoccus sp. Bi-70]